MLLRRTIKKQKINIKGVQIKDELHLGKRKNVMKKNEKLLLLVYIANLIQIAEIWIMGDNQELTFSMMLITTYLYIASKKKKELQNSIIMFLAFVMAQSIAVGSIFEQYLYTIVIYMISIILIFFGARENRQTE